MAFFLISGFISSSPSSITYQYPRTNVIIFYNGVSFVITLFKSDFVDYVKCNIPVKDVTKVNTVIGIGTTMHKFFGANVIDVLLPCIYYHLTTTYVKLLSPQTYPQLHGAHSIIRYFMLKLYQRTILFSYP